MQSAERFDGKAADYAAGRPAYAEELFDLLFARYGFAAGGAVADIGAGTGIFTEALLRRGCTVFAVEPNAEMRKTAEERLSAYGGFISVAGDAARTGLASGSVGAVTAAQAFHWFDADAFAAECRRILRPGGRVVLAYNRDDDSPLRRALDAAAVHFCPAFRGRSGGMTEQDGRIAAFFGEKPDIVRFANGREEDEQTFVRRALSSSYVPSGEGKERYADAVRDVFACFAAAGKVFVPRTTWAYIGEMDGEKTS